MIEYFPHDYNARNEIKIKKLFMNYGLTGIGLYWCLIEMLYENGGYVLLEQIPVIAFDLRIEEQTILNTINNYDLFSKNDSYFFSSGVLKRLEIRENKKQKAINSANYRWHKNNKTFDSNANALQTHCDSNANKENKRKENINNNIKEINKENTVLSNDDLLNLINENFQDEDVKQKFIDYSEMRKAKGQRFAIRTKATFKTCFDSLHKYAKTKEELIQVLENSIAGGWQGLFPLKNGNQVVAPKKEGSGKYDNIVDN